MPGGREDGHVGADLGDDHLGGAPLHAGDRAEQLNRRRRKGAICSSIASESRSICSSRKSMWARICADDQRVLGVEAALERLAQRRQLLAQLPFGELGEHRRVGRARDERVEHRPAGLAEDVGGDAVELDPGVLEDLVQPVGLALALAGSAPCGSGSGCAASRIGLGGTKLALQQPGLEQLAQPRGVRDVGLAAGHLLDVAGVDEQAARSRPRGPPRPASSTRRWPPSPPA